MEAPRLDRAGVQGAYGQGGGRFRRPVLGAPSPILGTGSAEGRTLRPPAGQGSVPALLRSAADPGWARPLSEPVSFGVKDRARILVPKILFEATQGQQALSEHLPCARPCTQNSSVSVDTAPEPRGPQREVTRPCPPSSTHRALRLGTGCQAMALWTHPSLSHGSGLSTPMTK